MPVVGIPVERLRSLLGTAVSRDDLLVHLGRLGCDVEGYTQLERVRCNRCAAVMEMTASEEIPPQCETCGADLREDHTALEPLEVIRMELLAVRPDMFDPGGLARVMRGYLGVEKGAPRYALGEVAMKVTVDPQMREPDAYRPHIACAVVENVTLDPDTLRVVMKLQENLHWALGRDRRHASIGVYDLDTLTPDITYTAEDPDAFRFVPLGADGLGRAHTMSLRQILEEHPKGIAYAHLLKDHKRYPILKDSTGLVLSMPPIINSENTKVTQATKGLFVDVTGLGTRVVERSLNILITSLLENMPGAVARTVEVVGRGDGARRLTPDFAPQEMQLAPEHASRVIGVDVSDDDAVDFLQRMRHDAELTKPGTVRVQVPAYRNDIIHEVDLIEDLAIAYGYHRIPSVLVPTFTVGGERPIEARSNRMREVLCGLGFLEVMTLILTSPEAHDDALGSPRSESAVHVAHPVSSEQTMLRTNLRPGLLATFQHNVTHPLPQHIFEVGDVTLLNTEAETLAREERRFACGVTAARVGFEDAKAIAEVLLRECGQSASLKPLDAPPFLKGRAAEAWLDSAGDAEPKRALWFGEVHPEVLGRFNMQNPAILLEGDLEVLVRSSRHGSS